LKTVVALCLGVAVLVPLASVSAAAAGKSGPSYEDPVLWPTGQLDAIATLIDKGLPGDEQSSIPGYTGLYVDGATGTLTVYWHGPVPANVTRAIALANSTPGLRGVLRQAPFSLKAEEVGAAKLFAPDDKGFVRLHGLAARIVGLSCNPDGTGLTLRYEPTDTHTAPEPGGVRRYDGPSVPSPAAVEAVVEEIAGVPVIARAGPVAMFMDGLVGSLTIRSAPTAPVIPTPGSLLGIGTPLVATTQTFAAVVPFRQAGVRVRPLAPCSQRTATRRRTQGCRHATAR
jgi:hypothetical protein